MTQKEKIMEAFVAFQIIKSSAESLKEEAKDYGVRFPEEYAESIINQCNKLTDIINNKNGKGRKRKGC